MKELLVPESNDWEIVNYYLHNPNGDDEEYTISDKTYEKTEKTRWNFSSGNPEFWKFQDQLLVPGGKLLDVGSAHGRSSMFFGLHGMHITAVDPDPFYKQMYQETADNLGVELRSITATLQEAGLQNESFDTILLDHTFAHLRSREEASEILEAAWKLLKPGGYIWLRANGIEDSGYWDREYEAKRGYSITHFGHAIPSEFRFIEDGLIEHPCGCSGRVQMDHSIYFEQLDLPLELASYGAEVTHLQCIPMRGQHNKMYGEDFNHEHGRIYQSGTVTVIAKKPQKKA